MSPAIGRKRATPARKGLKRKRASAVVEESESSPWALLDGDLLRLVAWRVLAGEFADYVRLRAACRHWRSSTACPRGRGVVDPRFHPRHWMMLPEGHCLYPGHNRLRGRVRFFNLRTGAFASVALPIFKGHFALDSVDGLLLLQRDHDMAVRLLHPFTGDVVDLPSLATLLPQLAAHFNPFERAHMQEIEFLKLIRHVCAAVSYSPDDGVITVLLALTKEHVPRVAFATSKDQQWTLSSWESPGRIRIMSLQGKLYFFTARSQFLMVEPPQQHLSSMQPPKLIATCPPDKIRCPYLAECNSEILLVGYPDSFSLDIVIYRLSDLVLGRITPLKSIGGNSIFLMERSICVSSKAHPIISGDCCLLTQSGQVCWRIPSRKQNLVDSYGW